ASTSLRLPTRNRAYLNTIRTQRLSAIAAVTSLRRRAFCRADQAAELKVDRHRGNDQRQRGDRIPPGIEDDARGDEHRVVHAPGQQDIEPQGQRQEQADEGRAAEDHQSARRDQAPSSTNTSSRFLRIIGKSAMTIRIAAIASSTPEIGRGRKVVGSPRAISMARRRFSSISGPSTKPSSIGAGSKSVFTSQ